MNIRLFETFAGVGSQHTALRNIRGKNDSVKLVGISEWDMYAVISYYKMNGHEFNENYSSDKSDEEIRSIIKELPYSLDSKKLTDQVALQPIKMLRKLYEAHVELRNIPDITTLRGIDIVERNVNLLTYSFPCQDLSNAGHGRGMSKESNTRSGLLWEVERVIEEIIEQDTACLPKYLLMENVTAIVDKRHRPDYALWKERLEEFGYTSYDGTLNALDFGIPQTRKRFFCLSILKPKNQYETDNLDELLEDYKVPTQPLENFLKLNYKIEKYKLEADNATPNHTDSRVEMFGRERILTREVQNYRAELDIKYRARDVYIRTLTTKQDRWNNGGMLHYYEKKFNQKENLKDKSLTPNGYSKFRFLTNREAYLLMGFKEQDIDRIFEENISREKMYRQAGNSIVVNVLEAIFRLIQEEERCS